MKRFIATVFFLGCFVCLVFLVLDKVEQTLILSSPLNNSYKINRSISQNNRKEIPMFGSSRMMCHCVPSLLSSNCFNYGQPGVGLSTVLFCLKKELEKQKEGPIIINIDPWGNNIDPWGRSDSVGDLRSYILNNDDPDVQCLLSKEVIHIQKKIPGVRFYGFTDNLAKDIGFFVLSRKARRIEGDSGFSIQYLSRTVPDDVFEGKGVEPHSFGLDTSAKENLKTVLQALPASRRILIVISPCIWSYYSLFQNKEDLDAFVSEISCIKNVYVFNFFDDSLTYPKEYWADALHLNYTGARFFTRKFLEKIQAIPDLEKWFPRTVSD